MTPSTFRAGGGARRLLALALASHPRAGETVGDTLREIRLEFSERVAAGMTSLVLTTGEGTTAQGALAELPGSRGRIFVFRLAAKLAPGPYTAVWHTAAEDGHVVHGTLSFIVRGAAADTSAHAAAESAPTLAAPADTAGGQDAGMAEDDEQGSDAASPLSVAVRWAEFVALLAMLGAVAFNLLVARRLRGDAALERVADRAAYGAWHIAAGAAALSALSLFARLWLQSVALNGATDAFDGQALGALLTGTVWGSGWLLQAIATVAFFVGLMVARAPHGRTVGWMGAGVAAVILAAVPALSGHAAAVEQATAIAIVSDWLHVAGAGVWLGTLATVLLAGLPAASFAGPGAATPAFARLVGAFSPVALAGAGVAAVTGVINSVFHFHRVSELWTTGYGNALLVKLALLGIVAGLGFINWRYVLPGLERAQTPALLRKTAALELAVGLLVVLVTAVLVALPPP